MKKSILIICFALYSFSVIGSVSGYCSLCAGHIACNHTGNFDRNCPSDASIERFTATERAQLLDLHNDYRDQIAGGQIGQFPTASRMNAVVSLLMT